MSDYISSLESPGQRNPSLGCAVPVGRCPVRPAPDPLPRQRPWRISLEILIPEREVKFRLLVIVDLRDDEPRIVEIALEQAELVIDDMTVSLRPSFACGQLTLAAAGRRIAKRHSRLFATEVQRGILRAAEAGGWQ